MKKLLLSLIIGFSSLSYADGIKALQSFLQNKTIKADFTQQVQSGKKTTTSTGIMEISRPNQFKWDYKEDGQLIVSDGKSIYIYDEPLMQVTKKKLGGALGRSPALLLSGSTDINKFYNLRAVSGKDNLQWVELKPKKADDNNGFEVVSIGFDQAGRLAKMTFVDSFGNTSNINFTNLQTKVNFLANEFKFNAPKGVDVIDQE